MSYLLDISDDSCQSLSTSDSLKGLLAIRQPGCAAAIWHRSPLPKFQSWIDSLAPEHLPSSRVILRPNMVSEALVSITRACGMPKDPERDLLIDDASALAAIFADIMRVDYLRVRLEVVGGKARQKFHVSSVTARLVCTYRGTGIQYGISADGSDPRRVFTVPTGSPIILRGTRWPETPISGLLHRSPPMDRTGETRLVLTLDPVVDPADEPDRHFMH